MPQCKVIKISICKSLYIAHRWREGPRRLIATRSSGRRECLLDKPHLTVASTLSSPRTAFSQAFWVNSLRWRIQGERAGNASLLRLNHVTRDELAARNNEAQGLGKLQPRFLRLSLGKGKNSNLRNQAAITSPPPHPTPHQLFYQFTALPSGGDLLFKLFPCPSSISVPTAKPITFAKINFNVIGLKETKDFVALIRVLFI